MTLANFEDVADQLAKLNGLSPDTASHYLSLIGDTPELAEDGKVIVIDDDGKEIARIVME